MHTIRLVIFFFLLTPVLVHGQVVELPHEESRDAEFPGGEDEMMNYIFERLIIPEGESLSGDVLKKRIYVKVTVTPFGDLRNIEVIKGAGDLIDQQLVSIFKGMPRWEPALLDGVAIEETYSFPIKLAKRK
jgi:hypothetical protein